MKGRIVVLLVVLLSMTIRGQAREMSIQVREGVLRGTPSFLGAVIAQVSYGERVTVLDNQNGWTKVRADGSAGWIHESALTKKRLTLSAGDSNVKTGASSEEMALAGKGFNSEVEAEFKEQNEDVDFTDVDRMEAICITQPEMLRFLKKGGVVPPQGGAM